MLIRSLVTTIVVLYGGTAAAQFPEIVCLPFTESDIRRTPKLALPTILDGHPALGHSLSRLHFIHDSGWLIGLIESFIHDPEPAPQSHWLDNPRNRLFERNARAVAINVHSAKVIQLRIMVKEQYFDKGEQYEFVELIPIDVDRVAVVVDSARNDGGNNGRFRFPSPYRPRHSRATIWEWNLRTQQVAKANQSLQELLIARCIDPDLFETTLHEADDETMQLLLKSRSTGGMFETTIGARDLLIPSRIRNHLLVFRNNNELPTYGISCYDQNDLGNPLWHYGIDKVAGADASHTARIELCADAHVRVWSHLPIFVSSWQPGNGTVNEVVVLDLKDGKEILRKNIGTVEYFIGMLCSNDIGWVAIVAVQHASLIDLKSQDVVDVRLGYGEILEGINSDGTLVMSNVNDETWLGVPKDGVVARVDGHLFSLRRSPE